MKYAKLENNIVVQIQPNEQEGFIEVDDNVVAGMFFEKNSFIIKDLRTEEELEEARVQNINSYTQSYIYSKYPQPKQSSANLGVYDEAYKNEMVAFIKRVIDLSNEAIANGTSFEDYKAMLNE